MASTVMFSPYDPARAMPRRIVASTGNAYQIDARGSAQVDVSDVAWFQTQGFSPTPTAAGGQSLMYAPYMADQEMARPITNPITGTTYFINAAGCVAVATADIAWFQTQGYALVPTVGTGTLMSTQVEVGQALSGPLFSPITGNMYVMNGQGWIIAAAADVAWLQGQGFAPVTGGGVAPPIFPPTVSGTNATIAADFAGQQYWASAASQASFAAWLTAIGGTYTRASSATYLQGGVVKTATANTPRFPTDLGGTAQGIRLTGAATNIHPQSSVGGGSIASYNSTSGTIAAGAVVDPSGGSAAASFIPSTANVPHFLYLPLGVNITNSTAYVFSAYVKPFGTATYQAFLDPDNTATYGSIFTLVGAGSVASAGLGVGTIQQLANGWYRITQTFVAGTTGGVFAGIYCYSGGNRIFTGDGVSGLYVWGVQYEAGQFATDYIPTTTATVTQAADLLSLPYTQTTSSMLVGTNNILNNTGGEAILGSNADVGMPIFDNSGAGASGVNNAGQFLNGPSYIGGPIAPHKWMTAGSLTGRSITVDAAVPVADANALFSPAASLALGSRNAGGQSLIYGNFSQFALWNALVASTAEMQRLTT